jgi:hypothetical protein
LLDCRGAKGVGGAQHDRALLVLETLGELADGRRLSRPVHSHHQYHGRGLGHARRSAFASLQDLEQLLANETLQLDGIVQLVALHAFLDALEDFFGRSHPHVRRNQREFQFVEQVAINLPFALKRVFERGYKARPRFLHTGFQLFEQRGLLLDRAEEGLNHFSFYSNNRDRESAGLGRRGCAATICEGGETGLGRARHAVLLDDDASVEDSGNPRSGLPRQPTVYTRTLSIFSGAARVKEPRAALPAAQKQTDGPDFLASPAVLSGPHVWMSRLLYAVSRTW